MYSVKDRGEKKINRHHTKAKYPREESQCVYLVGLQKNCVLWAASAKPDD